MRVRILAPFLALSTAYIALSAQTMCVGKNGTPCTGDGGVGTACNAEKTPANLSVSSPVHLTGKLIDASGAPIDFDSLKSGYQTIIQIRNPDSREVIFAVPLRKNGEFEFELVPAASYRLIAVWMHDGKFGRLPLADQPEQLACKEEKDCRLVATIRLHGTDNPIDFCPPK
jgi:hypothetical protein